ncbi:hypothetical protein ACSVDA_01380 [Cytobacillus sp. Hm23]
MQGPFNMTTLNPLNGSITVQNTGDYEISFTVNARAQDAGDIATLDFIIRITINGMEQFDTSMRADDSNADSLVLLLSRTTI